MDYTLTEGRLHFGLNGRGNCRSRYHSDRGARR